MNDACPDQQAFPVGPVPPWTAGRTRRTFPSDGSTWLCRVPGGDPSGRLHGRRREGLIRFTEPGRRGDAHGRYGWGALLRSGSPERMELLAVGAVPLLPPPHAHVLRRHVRDQRHRAEAGSGRCSSRHLDGRSDVDVPSATGSALRSAATGHPDHIARHRPGPAACRRSAHGQRRFELRLPRQHRGLLGIPRWESELDIRSGSARSAHAPDPRGPS